jgi:hypothetical protein
MEQHIPMVKDLGLNRTVLDALPTAVVGGAHEGSLWNTIITDGYAVLLNHIVPNGQQLKMLFMRVFTTNANGCRFAIVQINPAAQGQTGTVEAFPVVGSVPPYSAGLTAVRDYPMLEAAGAEVLHGSLRDPIHVFEGSIEFRLLGYLPGPADERYGFVWWGVEETQEEP